MDFLSQMEDFLYTLRDNYDFLLPVDRLKLCLACAQDITDVEEVLYRLQALTCGNEQQIETFQSLFAQRFLGLRPRPAASTNPKPGNKPAAPMSATEREALTAKLESCHQHLSQASDRAEKLRREMEEREAEVGQAKGQEAAVQGEIDQLNAKKLDRVAKQAAGSKDKKLRDAIKAARKQLESSSLPKETRMAVEYAMLSPNFKKELEPVIKEVMAAAAKARTANRLAEFKSILSLVSALKDYQAAAGKSLLNDSVKMDLRQLDDQIAEKKLALAEAESKTREQQRHYQDASKKKIHAEREVDKAKREIPALQARLDQDKKKAEMVRMWEEGRTVVKPAARSHRDLFKDGINAVQTTKAQARLLATNLSNMPADAKRLILSYIRSNAKVFRQTLRRKSAAPQKHQIDIRATMRAATRSGGEPFLIRYKKPKKSHAKVVIVTDISGSCRHASTLALYFMAMMNDAFPGGCRKYVFVNSLVPVDKYFRDRSADAGVEAVNQNVPSRGIYSNYGQAIHELREELGGAINKDTTVIVLGDARNNKNASAAEDLKYIADRCRRVFWLNPDKPEKWNTGDSVIGAYQKAGAEAHYVETAADLIGFLSGLPV